jgi:hypothetical protein
MMGNFVSFQLKKNRASSKRQEKAASLLPTSSTVAHIGILNTHAHARQTMIALHSPKKRIDFHDFYLKLSDDDDNLFLEIDLEVVRTVLNKLLLHSNSETQPLDDY